MIMYNLPLIRQFSRWKCKQDGREIIVLDANSSWVHVKGLKSGKRSHISAEDFLKRYK